MCRMIGAIGDFDKSEIIDAATAMSECRIATHEHGASASDPSDRWTHVDGWGAAYLAGNNLKCVRRVSPLTTNDAHESLVDAAAGLLVIHARKSSLAANKGLRFTHPAECTIRKEAAYFFHNGWVKDAFRLLKKERSEWDTGELLEWLTPAFETEDRGAELRRRLEELAVIDELGQLPTGGEFPAHRLQLV